MATNSINEMDILAISNAAFKIGIIFIATVDKKIRTDIITPLMIYHIYMSLINWSAIYVFFS